MAVQYMLGFTVASAIALMIVGGVIANKGTIHKDNDLEGLGVTVIIVNLVLLVWTVYQIFNFPVS